MSDEALTGGCQCARVWYRVEAGPKRFAAGTLATFEATCDSGRVKTCAFCRDCGVRIPDGVPTFVDDG